MGRVGGGGDGTPNHGSPPCYWEKLVLQNKAVTKRVLLAYESLVYWQKNWVKHIKKSSAGTGFFEGGENSTVCGVRTGWCRKITWP